MRFAWVYKVSGPLPLSSVLTHWLVCFCHPNTTKTGWFSTFGLKSCLDRVKPAFAQHTTLNKKTLFLHMCTQTSSTLITSIKLNCLHGLPIRAHYLVYSFNRYCQSRKPSISPDYNGFPLGSCFNGGAVLWKCWVKISQALKFRHGS